MSENAESIVKGVKEVQGAVEAILRDTLGDYKEREKAREKRDIRKDITIWALIIALVGTFIYCQWSFKNFLEQYEFSYEEYSQDGQGYNNINTGEQGDVINGAVVPDSDNETQGP